LVDTKELNMKKIKLGFVPSHREPFDKDWAMQMRQRCLDVFSQIPGLEVICPDAKTTPGGLVCNDKDAENTINLFREKEIDGLIIGTMTFGDEVAALTVASAFQGNPILLFGTREDAFTPGGCRKSDSFCGTLSISSGLYRRDIFFDFAGIVFPEEKPFQEKLKDFIRVCSVIQGFVGAKIGLVGPRPERFETCIFSEDPMMQQFAQRVVPTSLPDIMERARKIKNNSPEIKRIALEMKKQADLSALKEDNVLNMIRLELALEQFAAEKGLSGMGIQCWTAIQEVYRVSPCYVMGRLTDKGIMTACEVDIYGVLTMLIQNLASLGKTPPHFIDWTIRHQEKENVFLAWHCGNAPPSLLCKSSGISIKYHSILGESLGIDRSMGTGEFQLKPGAVTLGRLIEHEGQFKMLITSGKIIESNQKIRGSWSWVETSDLNNLYEVLVQEGFTHHASLIHGDYVKVIRNACKYLGINEVVV
jgi:L-fucose isomerase-like protein